MLTGSIRRSHQALALKWWLILALGFSVIFPFWAGAVFIPIGRLLHGLLIGPIILSDVPILTVEILMTAPIRAAQDGTPILYTGPYAGILWGAGSWLIDRLGASESTGTSNYGPWIVTFILGATVVSTALLGPISLLYHLG